VLYLPVLLAATLFAVALAPSPYAVTWMVADYVVLRVGSMIALAAVGRSIPDLPIAALGLLVADLLSGAASCRATPPPQRCPPWHGRPPRRAWPTSPRAPSAWLHCR
jgi:hypothetical protein